uniref:Uncharacterized protein n=1 Tax=Ditylenchus dipsaci TaxID=166011 RepID=A0A915CV41_9BILA
MHMLSFYLDLAKRRAYERLYMFQSKAKPVNHEYEERKEILHGYIGAQDMAIVQTLLEVCDGDVDKTPELLEIQKIACLQIHRMFISDSSSLLPKLVHYNTYPLRLIPVMVKGVPSAHVVINFIGDIMASANIRRRVFGVHLMAELVQQYKIPMAFAGVELISDVLDTLLSCTASDEILLLIHHIVPALGQFISVSPFHASSFLQILERVRQVSLARRAFYSSSIAARRSLESRLTDLINSTMERCKRKPAIDVKEHDKPEENPKVKLFKLNEDRNRRGVKRAKLSGKTR